MRNQNEKFGIVVSIGITSIVLGIIIGTGTAGTGSMQAQGKELLEETTNEIENIPNTMEKITTKTIDESYETVSEIPQTANEIVKESDSVEDIIEKSSEVIEDTLPNVPKVVKQTDGKLIELVTIPPNTDMPGCEKKDVCFLPSNAQISPKGEVIWTNNDDVAHTITSGGPVDGPNGLFDSGLIAPGDTYSLQFDIAFEYDYFCMIHPWMTGSISVE